MKQIVKKLFFILPLFLLASCSANADSADKKFKVALLTTGPVTDGGWNASAYEGLKRIETELGAEVSQMETRTPLEFEEGYREYAKLGYDLVIGHGFEFQDAANKLGARYPETVFLVSAGNQTQGNNVSPVSFKLEEGAYLLGMIAGKLSQTGVVGVIGGMALPPVKKAFSGFESGFKLLCPEGKVLTIYLGSWEDVNGGKEAALAQIREGADFIIHNADAAGWGVVQAARTSKNVIVFGTNRDQTTMAPDVIQASAVCDIPEIFIQNAKNIKDGKFIPRAKPYGLKEKGVWLSFTPSFKEKIPADLLEMVQQEEAKILAGELEL